MALVCIVYAIYGGVLPGILGHRGYELSRTKYYEEIGVKIPDKLKPTR